MQSDGNLSAVDCAAAGVAEEEEEEEDVEADEVEAGSAACVGDACMTLWAARMTAMAFPAASRSMASLSGLGAEEAAEETAALEQEEEEERVLRPGARRVGGTGFPRRERTSPAMSAGAVWKLPLPC